MKKTLTHVFLLMLVCVLSLSLVACGGKESKPAEGGSETTEGVDWTQYPEKFEDWQIANLKAYLRETGVFENNDWIIDVTGGDLDAIGATAGTMYIDMTGGTIMDMVFFFDGATDESKGVLDGLRESKEIVPDVEGAPATPMDAMLGGFCFSYTMGSDADHNAALVKAIKDLADHYSVTPDFIAE